MSLHGLFEYRPTEKVTIKSGSGLTIDLPICRSTFSAWSGTTLQFDFGKKPVLDFEGHPMFAELIILRLLQADGWEGAWVETYGGIHFLQEMPADWKLQSNHVAIPEEREVFLRKIWGKGKTTACFDVFAWKGDDILFCEAKRKGRDRLTDAQYKFIEAALECGVKPEQLLIVEWDTAH